MLSLYGFLAILVIAPLLAITIIILRHRGGFSGEVSAKTLGTEVKGKLNYKPEDDRDVSD